MNPKTKKYPTRDECLKILKHNNCSEEVIEHIIAVNDLALKIAEYFPKAKLELIESGALLHDLGRSRTHGIDHAVEGAKLARALGISEDVVKIIERHICAGISPEDAESLGLPKKDYTPRALEERIVAHADNLHDGSKRCTIQFSYQYLCDKGLIDVAERVRQLHKTLSQEAGIDLDEI